MDAIIKQKLDDEEKRRFDADRKKREDERLLQMMRDNSDILQRLADDHDKK